MMKKQSIKRMVLTGAAVAVMLSLAAPAAMAQEVRDHRDGNAEAGPIVRDHRDGSGGILCDIFSIACDPPPYHVSDPVIPPPVVNEPPDPVVDPPPKHCEFLPKGCKPPFGDDPVLDPGDGEDPVVTDPPDEEEDPVADPSDKEEDPDKDEQPGTDGGSGGNSSGGSGGSSGSATTGGGGSGGSVSSASQTIDSGGTYVSSFLPYAFTTKMGDAGNAAKKNLPASVAKSLPNTGGGWSFLVLIGAALIAGGFVIRTIVRRTTSVTRTAQ
jgi:LPXTG-motif cell wall-anchored protein